MDIIFTVYFGLCTLWGAYILFEQRRTNRKPFNKWNYCINNAFINFITFPFSFGFFLNKIIKRKKHNKS